MEIDGVGRRVADLPARTRGRLGRRRRRRDDGDKARWWGHLDIPTPEIDSLTAIAAVPVVVAAILVAVLTGELFLGAVVPFLLDALRALTWPAPRSGEDRGDA